MAIQTVHVIYCHPAQEEQRHYPSSSYTLIINSTSDSYLMIPHKPAPALGFTTAKRHSKQSLAGGQGLLSKQDHPLLRRPATSFCCRKASAPLFTVHSLALLLWALSPRCWQHVALYSCWMLKIPRKFNAGRTPRPNLSSAETTVALPDSTGCCSWSLHLLHSDEFVSGYITLSKTLLFVEMQLRFQVYLYILLYKTRS